MGRAVGPVLSRKSSTMKITQHVENNKLVFSRTETISLLNGRLIGTKEPTFVAQQRFIDYCEEKCINRKVHL